ncbi:MAG TPA: hypothetical protein VM241_07800 [Candidatus Thermoplasmatota archaeon]|nr:hypothetical protein [Candidatus Thermoplasmatota archaeon]
MKTVLIAGLLALALLPPALAHNGGPATSGSCGVMACEDQVILNGCGLEVEVQANVGNPLDLSELPCAHAAVPPVDHDRWSSHPAAGAAENRAGISGRYVASTGPLLEVTGSQSSIFPQQGLGPIVLFGLITTLCDIEVGGDGQSPDPNLDETTVDSTPGGNTVPNALWDDGGIAGACHTSTYGYDNAAHTLYNTPGCPTGNYAMAEDMVLGDSVEIGVGCDNTSTAPGNTGGPDLLGAISCVINEVILQQDPGSLNGCVLPALGCVLNAGTCTDPTTLICGSDGTTDTINFGEGGGHANPYTDSGLYNEDGVPYPAPANGCSNLGGNGQVYVIAGVRLEVASAADLTSGNDGVGISLSLVPTMGWISEISSGSAAPIAHATCNLILGTGTYECTGTYFKGSQFCTGTWTADETNGTPYDSGDVIISETC